MTGITALPKPGTPAWHDYDKDMPKLPVVGTEAWKVMVYNLSKATGVGRGEARQWLLSFVDYRGDKCRRDKRGSKSIAKRRTHAAEHMMGDKKVAQSAHNRYGMSGGLSSSDSGQANLNKKLARRLRDAGPLVIISP